MHDRIFKSAGTDGYKAPEIRRVAEGHGSFNLEPNEDHENDDSSITQHGYSGIQADIFALGVILFILHFGIPPFSEACWEDRLFKLLNFKSNAVDKKTSLRYFLRNHPATKELLSTNQIDYDLMDLITSLLEENPNDRPIKIQSIKLHPYLNKHKLNEETLYT